MPTSHTTIPEHCELDLRRLRRSLVYGPASQWFLLDAPEPALRQAVSAALEPILQAHGLHSHVLHVPSDLPHVHDLELLMREHAQLSPVVYVHMDLGWWTPARWGNWNLRRERIAAKARARWVFWLDAPTLVDISAYATDFWSWRAGIYTFTAQPV